LKAKLYSPIHCDICKYDKYGGCGFTEINPLSARTHLEDIRAVFAKERKPEESARGLMTYYDKADSVNEKVQSLFVDADVYEDTLWAVATLEFTEPLAADEISVLKNYLSWQYSDGFGEALEQRAINAEYGEIYVRLWKYGNNFIDTPEQFARRLCLPLPSDALAGLNTQDAPHDITELINLLHYRIDRNLNDFFINIGNDAAHRFITAESKQIAAVCEAHCFLKAVEADNWNTADLEYLLRFKNPLKLFADKLPGAVSGNIDMFGVMFAEGGILDRREQKPRDYALTPEAYQSYLESPENRLRERLAENFNEYKRDMLDMDKEKIFFAANEIAPIQQAYEYFSQEHSYSKDEVDFLLKFQNPLERHSGRFGGGHH